MLGEMRCLTGRQDCDPKGITRTVASAREPEPSRIKFLKKFP